MAIAQFTHIGKFLIADVAVRWAQALFACFRGDPKETGDAIFISVAASRDIPVRMLISVPSNGVGPEGVHQFPALQLVEVVPDFASPNRLVTGQEEEKEGAGEGKTH